MGKGDKKDADRAKAEKRLEQEIGAEQTDEERARAEKKAEGMGRGINKGARARRSAPSPWRRAALASGLIHGRLYAAAP